MKFLQITGDPVFIFVYLCGFCSKATSWFKTVTRDQDITSALKLEGMRKNIEDLTPSFKIYFPELYTKAFTMHLP